MNPESIIKHILDINLKGFTIIKNGIDINLVDRVVNDFDTWASLPESKFVKNYFNRVTNFHIYSKNTMDLATNENVNNILAKLFNKEQAIYSSLFFREGTAQGFHRDTPHFYTNPIDKYYGVWYALEDIDINAGPLKYYIGSHLFEVPDGIETYNNMFKDKIKIDNNENLQCLNKYNQTIEELCKKNNLVIVNEQNYTNKINKGDIIIWHPKLLHGGSDIIDPTLTRYSMVTHNIPVNTQVFNASHFFSKEPTREYVENNFTYKYIKHNNINIVDHATNCKVQKTYI